MRKMPCVFVRDFHAPNTFTITPTVTPGCEWVIQGLGTAYRKRDGTACLWQDGVLYKRYDAKPGKTPPPGAVPCDPARDPVTGHWPHWVKVVEVEAADRWHWEAYQGTLRRFNGYPPPDGTYELCGPKLRGNPERLDTHQFLKHDSERVFVPELSFEFLRRFLLDFHGEGLVWHHPDGRMAKLRRADFGFAGPLNPIGDQR